MILRPAFFSRQFGRSPFELFRLFSPFGLLGPFKLTRLFKLTSLLLALCCAAPAFAADSLQQALLALEEGLPPRLPLPEVLFKDHTLYVIPPAQSGPSAPSGSSAPSVSPGQPETAAANQSGAAAPGEEDAAQITPPAPQALPGLYFVHVQSGANWENQASRPANGSRERPYPDIVPAIAAAPENAVIYIWPGRYSLEYSGTRQEKRGLELRRSLTLAGSGHELRLPGTNFLLPPQSHPSRGEVIWHCGGLWGNVPPEQNWPGPSSPPGQSGQSGPQTGTAAARHIAPIMLLVRPGNSLQLSGLSLENGRDNAIGIYMLADWKNSAADSAPAGLLSLHNVKMHGFSQAIASMGPVALVAGNSISGSGHSAFYGEGAAAALVLGRGNSIMDNPGPESCLNARQVLLRDNNSIRGNGGRGIEAAASLRLGSGNVIAANGSGLRAPSVVMGDSNHIGENRGPGILANQVVMGNENVVSQNLGNGIRVPLPHFDPAENSNAASGGQSGHVAGRESGGQSGHEAGRESGGLARLGNDNSLNRNQGNAIFCAGGNVIMGDENVMESNRDRGIYNQRGGIFLGRKNRVAANGQEGLAAPNGQVILNGGNIIDGNGTRHFSDVLTERKGTRKGRGDDWGEVLYQ